MSLHTRTRPCTSCARIFRVVRASRPACRVSRPARISRACFRGERISSGLCRRHALVAYTHGVWRTVPQVRWDQVNALVPTEIASRIDRGPSCPRSKRHRERRGWHVIGPLSGRANGDRSLGPSRTNTGSACRGIGRCRKSPSHPCALISCVLLAWLRWMRRGILRVGAVS